MYITLSGDTNTFRDICADEIRNLLQSKGIPSWKTGIMNPLTLMQQKIYTIAKEHGVTSEKYDTELTESLRVDFLEKNYGENVLLEMFEHSMKPIIEAFEAKTTLYAIIVYDCNSPKHLEFFKEGTVKVRLDCLNKSDLDTVKYYDVQLQKGGVGANREGVAEAVYNFINNKIKSSFA